jgi:transposase
MRPQDLTPDQQTAFRLLPQQDLKVARAWLLRERFAAFWDYTDPGAAEKFAARWSWRATPSRLPPRAAVIKRHLPNLLTYLTHKITNAGLEAVNSVIQAAPAEAAYRAG